MLTDVKELLIMIREKLVCICVSNLLYWQNLHPMGINLLYK